MTPTLPPWIREARIEGYECAHALVPTESRLFGTESLYGDWHGRVLLLAKDFFPSRVLHERIARGDERPYRHEPTVLTNQRLQRLAAPIEDAGLLYGSALANLLRNDGRVSGALPNRKEALAYGSRVLRFVIEHMPSLERIICLGQEAWECACVATGQNGDWADHRDRSEKLGLLSAAYHPAARIATQVMHRPFEAIAAALESKDSRNRPRAIMTSSRSI